MSPTIRDWAAGPLAPLNRGVLADKRVRLVERLLEGPRYVTHFTNVWRGLLLPETTASLQARFLAAGFEAWLRQKLQQNTPYDAMVRDLIAARGLWTDVPATNFVSVTLVGDKGQDAERLAARVSPAPPSR